MSDQIRWKPDPNGPDGGWWVCPIEGCDGAGFCFDIYPTDRDVAAQFGVHIYDDEDEDEDEDYDEEDFLDEADDPSPPANPPQHRPRIFGEDDIPF